MTMRPSSRETPLALPKVEKTSPRRTKSRFASRTSSRSFAKSISPRLYTRRCSMRSCGGEEISVADNHCGANEQDQRQGEKTHRRSSRAAPLLETQPPKRAEDDDAGHVQSPTGKAVFAHLGFAHGVEKELEIPGGSGESAPEIIGEHGYA